MPRYDQKQIAAELTATALGNAHFGNALRVAKDIPGTTPLECSLLDRFATGRHTAEDGRDLQHFANKLLLTPIQLDKQIRRDSVFTNAPGELGGLWGQVCAVENEMAEKLQSLPPGTAAVSGEHAWFLEDDGEFLILMHAAPIGTLAGTIAAASSRFDFNLEAVDVDEDMLTDYVATVNNAMADFKTIQMRAADDTIEPYTHPSMKG